VSKGISQRSNFIALLTEIKGRIQSAQTRAVLGVNSELVRLYWDIGRMIDERQAREGWGAAVVPRLAHALRNELPELKGFSERNIKLMLAFYRAYPNPNEFVQPAVAQMPSGRGSSRAAGKLAVARKGQPPVAQLLPAAVFWAVPWAHHVMLIQKVKDLSARRWYMEHALADGWSRNILAVQIEARAHTRHAKAVTNFVVTLPAPQSDRKRPTDSPRSV
jgi:predicted nuclease of restriction endonuclease-like (RecB) superfamily